MMTMELGGMVDFPCPVSMVDFYMPPRKVHIPLVFQVAGRGLGLPGNLPIGVHAVVSIWIFCCGLGELGGGIFSSENNI